MSFRTPGAARLRRTVPAAALACLGVIASGAVAAADNPTYVLQPQAMPAIAGLCERLKPTLHCADVTLDHDHVAVRLCAGVSGEESCFGARLDHPGSGCGATRWGPFCASFPDAAPAPAARDALAAALQATADEGVWTAPQPNAPPVAPSAAAPAGATILVRSSAVALLLILAPLAAGWLLGSGWRRARGQRSAGPVFALVVVLVPAVAALQLDAHVLLIGAWDALWLGLMVSGGILLAAHRACADWRNVALLLVALVGALLLGELGARHLLPPPPAFPSAEGPALFLADAMQVAQRTGYAPTQAGTTTCDAIYAQGGSRNTVPPTVFPATWQPRADATAHILHLGDSMVFGSSADGRFTDDLERLEPHTEHVNAAIAGTAPDVYLSLARLFVARQPFTAVVMHLTGNDFWGVDERQYPCSAWLPLLVYDDAHTHLRFAAAQHDEARSGFGWLMRNSPPPYVLRAGVRVSALAAHAAAAFVRANRALGAAPLDTTDAERSAHLRAILRDARDELAARHIPLIVDSFRDRQAVERGVPTDHGAEDIMQQIAQELGIVTIDTWQPLVAAVRRGEQPFTNAGGPTDSHFNAAGHALIAAWLHDTLPAAIARARVTPPPAAP